MQVVEIRVAALNLGATMSGMREFLDRHRADPVRFETMGDGPGTILIRAEFNGSDVAELFRREFDGSP
jgi:hypothetical protein